MCKGSAFVSKLMEKGGEFFSGAKPHTPLLGHENVQMRTEQRTCLHLPCARLRRPREREEKPEEEERVQGSEGRGRGQREGRGLRAAPRLPPRPGSATLASLGTLCWTPLSSLVPRFRGSCVSLVLGLTFKGAGFPACCEIRG